MCNWCAMLSTKTGHTMSLVQHCISRKNQMATLQAAISKVIPVSGIFRQQVVKWYIYIYYIYMHIFIYIFIVHIYIHSYIHLHLLILANNDSITYHLRIYLPKPLTKGRITDQSAAFSLLGLPASEELSGTRKVVLPPRTTKAASTRGTTSKTKKVAVEAVVVIVAALLLVLVLLFRISSHRAAMIRVSLITPLSLFDTSSCPGLAPMADRTPWNPNWFKFGPLDPPQWTTLL